MNKTTTSKIFLAGHMHGSGKCEGGSIVLDGITYTSMVHYKEFHITITSYLAQFESTTQNMLTNGYGFCKLSAGSCDTGPSRLLYQTPAEVCDLVFLKTVEFIEMSGQQQQLPTSKTHFETFFNSTILGIEVIPDLGVCTTIFGNGAVQHF
jgi:hypothetical protein